MKTKLFPRLTGTCVLFLLLNPAARAADTDATNTPPAATVASEDPKSEITTAMAKYHYDAGPTSPTEAKSILEYLGASEINHFTETAMQGRLPSGYLVIVYSRPYDKNNVYGFRYSYKKNDNDYSFVSSLLYQNYMEFNKSEAVAPTAYNPPDATAASEPTKPTYDETLDWIKKKFSSEDCHYVNHFPEEKSGSTSHDTQSLDTRPDGSLTIKIYTEFETMNDFATGKVERAGKSEKQITFDLKKVKEAYVDTATYGARKLFESYCVILKSEKGAKNIHWSETFNWQNATSDNDRSNYSGDEDDLLIIRTSDKETAEKVAKAFNHLIKLAPKDLF